MGLKIQLKKVISAHSKYSALKVWKIDVHDDSLDGTSTMRIEVTVKKRKKKTKS